MASIIFNKRGMQSRLGKVGRNMVRNNEVVRANREGFIYVIDHLFDDVYSISCFYSWDILEGEDVLDCPCIELCWASFSMSRPRLRRFGLGLRVHTVNRDHIMKTTSFLRFRLDVDDVANLSGMIDDVIDGQYWEKHELLFPTDGRIDFSKPIITWYEPIDQQDLIMEQQEN